LVYVPLPPLKELDLISQGASHLAIVDKDADVHDRRWSEGGEGQKHGLLSGECLVLRSRVGSRCETVRASYQREPCPVSGGARVQGAV